MSALVVSPTQRQVYKTLGQFIASVLPAGVKVEQGEINRVPEPSSADFVVMWIIMRGRMGTNLDTYLDAAFTGSIAGNLLTITAVDPEFTGKLAIGSVIFGLGVATGTTITGLGTGTGGVGTYQVNMSQTVSSETLAAGTESLLQSTELQIQIDVHGPNSSDNSQIISTLFRDEYAVDAFGSFNIAQSLDPLSITPLFVDDPKQIPFMNAEQQYEYRYTITAHIQANQTVVVPMQFAEQLDVATTNPII